MDVSRHAQVVGIQVYKPSSEEFCLAIDLSALLAWVRGSMALKRVFATDRALGLSRPLSSDFRGLSRPLRYAGERIAVVGPGAGVGRTRSVTAAARNHMP